MLDAPLVKSMIYGSNADFCHHLVEEVTRLLLERGEHGGIQAIPPTLQQSLMARLDRLGPAREVAQVGSVIGRGFSYGLLRTLAGMADTALETALEQLAEADILPGRPA